jgi:single-strand DNA-binding protein
MINRIIIAGRLTRDPETRYYDSKPCCKFAIAVDRPFRNQQTSEKETDFIDVTAFGRNAEFVQIYVSKGRLVAVDGRLQIRSWTADDGTKRTRAEVVADNVQALDKPKDTDARKPAPDPDDPFADD